MSSIQFVKNNFLHLCVIHKNHQLFFGIVDRQAKKM